MEKKAKRIFILVLVLGVFFWTAVFGLIVWRTKCQNLFKEFSQKENTVYYTEDKSIVIYFEDRQTPAVATVTKDNETTTCFFREVPYEGLLSFYNFREYRINNVGGEEYLQNAVAIVRKGELFPYLFHDELIFDKIEYYSGNKIIAKEKKTMKFYSCPFSEWEGEIPDGTAMVETQKAKLKAEYEAKQN